MHCRCSQRRRMLHLTLHSALAHCKTSSQRPRLRPQRMRQPLRLQGTRVQRALPARKHHRRRALQTACLQHRRKHYQRMRQSSRTLLHQSQSRLRSPPVQHRLRLHHHSPPLQQVSRSRSSKHQARKSTPHQAKQVGKPLRLREHRKRWQAVAAQLVPALAGLEQTTTAMMALTQRMLGSKV